MKSFKKFVESCKAINEAEYNKEWWDSKSDSFKKRYIEKHPNSIYAQKANLSNKQKKDVTKFVDQAFGKNSKAAKTTRDNLSDNSTKNTQRKPIKVGSKEQPAKEWVDDAFDEANLHFKWQKAKDRMNYHGVDEFTIRDIIKSGNYEPEEIIDALNAGGHYKIDAMRDTIKKQEENKISSLDSVKRKYGKHYQTIEDFVSDYDVEQFSKAASEYAYDVADGPDDVENHFDDFDGEYNVHYDDLEAKFKKKFGFTPDKADIAAILDKVGGKVNLV